jgi:hypothetical protein
MQEIVLTNDDLAMSENLILNISIDDLIDNMGSKIKT